MNYLKQSQKDIVKTASIANDGSAVVGLFSIAELHIATERLID